MLEILALRPRDDGRGRGARMGHRVPQHRLRGHGDPSISPRIPWTPRSSPGGQTRSRCVLAGETPPRLTPMFLQRRWSTPS